ncbi:DUF2971 domain-containing protein [Pontibacter pamirensis]|uniref:DUF2971 domain-containing protein n=1 Tax=Pontibacter pamirensis TaxID=2562824 RepID=UPI00138A2108|nr:DUF2971 domain-containing protein [Pontibacter pamirensis]
MLDSKELERINASAERLNHSNIKVPTVFYHYTSIKAAMAILRSAKFKLSHPDSFNDPYDLDTSVIDFNCDAEIFMNHLAQLGVHNPLKDTPPNSELKKYMINASSVAFLENEVKRVRGGYRVGCFSKEYNNTLMWSHYAKSHSGVCIGFEYNAFNPECFVYPVKYLWKKESCNLFDSEIQPVFFVCYQKSRVWKYEREIRVVHFDTNLLTKGKVAFQKNSVLRLYFGLKTKPEDKKEVLSLLKKKKYTNVKIYDMIHNPKGYGFLKPQKIAY